MLALTPPLTFSLSLSLSLGHCLVVNFKGVEVQWKAEKLLPIYCAMETKIEDGIEKAVAMNQVDSTGAPVSVTGDNGEIEPVPMTSISPTFFWYECTSFNKISSPDTATSTGSTTHSSKQLLLEPTSFTTRQLPLYLEGATKQMRLLQTTGTSSSLALSNS